MAEWTKEEETKLLDMRSKGTTTTKEMAESLNRSASSVKNKLKKLEEGKPVEDKPKAETPKVTPKATPKAEKPAKKSKGGDWTPADDEFFQQNISKLTYGKIGEKLGKSFNQTKWHAAKLGLSKRKKGEKK